ncbi:hypothetical protein [Amycolatopsis rubida]|uniref:Uncharacterized protein n=1 Tax=Amycolatopsis rubida TaxID=112413 RepID=A0A1I5X632_9PSEU|nr:hypothetical protein [Amycolatopsis rubida]SFQ27432.1 hypothetical protein SAMN05421854_11053 [Amycolatopsis rubida]
MSTMDERRHRVPDPAPARTTVGALNEWNRRPDVPDGERMLCRRSGHGLMVALTNPGSSDGIRWQCAICSETQPITNDQVVVALGSEHLPVAPVEDHAEQVQMPPGMPGDRGDGTVRLSVVAQHSGISMSGLGIAGLAFGFLAGGALAGVVLHGGGVAAIVFSLVGGLIGESVSRGRYPVARVVASTSTTASALRPGDWVPVRPGAGPHDRATRIVQAGGLPLNHRRYPGVRLRLLSGQVIECHGDDAWHALTLS